MKSVQSSLSLLLYLLFFFPFFSNIDTYSLLPCNPLWLGWISSLWCLMLHECWVVPKATPCFVCLHCWDETTCAGCIFEARVIILIMQLFKRDSSERGQDWELSRGQSYHAPNLHPVVLVHDHLQPEFCTRSHLFSLIASFDWITLWLHNC